MISVRCGPHLISTGEEDEPGQEELYLNGRYLGPYEQVMGISDELTQGILERWASEFTPEYFDELNECVGWVPGASERRA